MLFNESPRLTFSAWCQLEANNYLNKLRANFLLVTS